MMDTHIIDCERCYRIARQIQEGAVPFDPFAPSKTGNPLLDYQLWEAALAAKPAFALPVGDFDHFVERCCDGRPIFAKIKLVKAGAA